MDKILTFRGFKTDHRLYNEEAQRALFRLPAELRDKIREAIESSTKNYIDELSKPVEIQIPENATKQQEQSIQRAIEKHQVICRALIQ